MSLVNSFYTDLDEAWKTLYALAHGVAALRLPSKLRREAEDIAKDSLAEIFTNKPHVNSEGQLKAYTVKVTSTKTADFCRRHRAQKRGAGGIRNFEDLNNQEETWEAICPMEEAVDRLSASELTTILINLSKCVTEGYRVILQDFYFGGLKHDEIARKRNIAIGSVGNYIKRGLDEMRKALKCLPGLKEELAHHLDNPLSVRIVLPLVGICRPDEIDGTSPGGFIVRNAEEGLPRDPTWPSLPSIASRRPSLPSDADELPAIRILPEDKPALAVLTPDALQQLRALVISHSQTTSSQKVPSNQTGCAALVLVLTIAILLGAILFCFRL